MSFSHLILSGAAGVSLGVGFLVAVPTSSGAAALPVETTRVSVSSTGDQGNHGSGRWDAVVSAGGRYVAFNSRATNFDALDSSDFSDIYVHDRVTGSTRRATVPFRASGALPAAVLDISGDGRWVVFRTRASNLVRGDTNEATDIFVRDMVGNKTIRVSVSSAEKQGNGASWEASISHHGRFVAFSSSASNLVKGDTNQVADVFVRNLAKATTRRISLSKHGLQLVRAAFSPSISADGNRIAFVSGAKNLVRRDTNGRDHVFVHNRLTGRNQLVSVGPKGHQIRLHSSDPDISADGRFVAFQTGFSRQSCYCQMILVRDRAATRSTVVSSGSLNNIAWTQVRASISAHGEFVAFMSNAPLPGETGDPGFRGLLGEVATGTLTPATLTASGDPVGGDGTALAISANTQWIVFASTDPTVVAGDTNGVMDVFARHR